MVEKNPNNLIWGVKGTIYSFATVYDAPEGFEFNSPYVVALIDLDQGPRITAQLTDLGDEPVQIGMLVEMVTRKLKEEGPTGKGLIVYGYKFRPPLKSPNPK